jgi:hypothetical protein
MISTIRSVYVLRTFAAQVAQGYCDEPVAIGGANYYIVFLARIRPGSYRKARDDVPIWVVPDADNVRIVAILLFKQASGDRAARSASRHRGRSSGRSVSRHGPRAARLGTRSNSRPPARTR